MNAKVLLAAALTASSIGLLAFAPRGTEAPAAAPNTWNIDPVHSSCIFRCKHFNTSYVYGRFEKVTGTINFDDANPAASSINVEIQTDTVSTANGNRDKHLKSNDFLGVTEYPTASFKSKEFKKSGDNTFDVKGDFTLRGVTKEITVKLEKTGQGKAQRGEIIGFESTFTIDRMDYGVKFMDAQLGHDVRLTVAFEAGKQ